MMKNIPFPLLRTVSPGRIADEIWKNRRPLDFPIAFMLYFYYSITPISFCRKENVMKQHNKIFLALAIFTLIAATLACAVGGSSSMAGKWLDPDTSGTVTTIVAQNGGYAVVSVINPNRGGNELTDTNWSNGVLTWTYCVPNGNCITSVTTSVSANTLDTTWTDDQGRSGTTTFQRQP